MKRILLSSAGLLALMVGVQTAGAADLPARPVYKAPVVVDVFSWTGCYIGIEGGGTWGRSRHINRTPAGVDRDITNDYDISGGLVGPTVGCNIQTGPVVFGIEGDWSWTNKRGSAVDIPPFNPAFTSETRENWIATVRGRLGWAAWDRVLIYATGGAAFADIEGRIIGPAAFGTVTERHTRTGWTVGGGFEYAFAPNWSFKLEYLYADFRRDDQQYFTPPPAGFVNRAGGIPTNDHIFRAGLNYRFNWGPVVARY